MRRILSRTIKDTGLAPGTPVHVGERLVEAARITVFEYDESHCEERRLERPEDCAAFRESNGVVWINVDGIHDISVVEAIGRMFGLHPLVQEDIVSTHQRPKIEEYDSYLFAVLKMLQEETESRGIAAEQVSIIITRKLVISFQEKQGDVFDPVRERLRQGKGQVRRRGSDYLAYCLIDAIVDNYFLIMEDLEDRIQPLEDAVVENPQPEQMRTIQGLKSDLVFLRRSLWPLREMLARLEREQIPLIHPDTRPFLRDVYDHTIRIIEILESFQEIIASLIDIYLSSISHRMNSIMKVLTIIATIFIPLTFIVGVYGMNFDHMPELSWRWGYPAVWGVMILVVVGLVVYFRRKKWL